MRLIDADALSNALYHEAFETDSDMQKLDSGCWIRYKMFENAIEKAPTVEERKTGKWIPVTERLPEKCGEYFVTKTIGCGRFVAREWFYKDKTWSTGYRVIAWMPVPRPYKGSEEE